MIIYCDLDGVLANFNAGAIEAADLPIEESDINKWGFFEDFMTQEEFWRRIHSNIYFWEDLPIYPWARSLVAELSKYGQVIFCTDPSNDDGSATGKICWLKRHGFVKPLGTNFALLRDKSMLAAPGRILIDDSIINCNQFQWAGGRSILFPTRWNQVNDCSPDPYEFLDNLPGLMSDKVRYSSLADKYLPALTVAAEKWRG